MKESEKNGRTERFPSRGEVFKEREKKEGRRERVRIYGGTPGSCGRKKPNRRGKVNTPPRGKRVGRKCGRPAGRSGDRKEKVKGLGRRRGKGKNKDA